MYYQRLATLNDTTAIALLWQEFLQERSHHDLSMVLKPDFDYVSYIKQKLKSDNIRGFILEYGENKQIVGFLFIYVHDETPNLDYGGMTDSPFQPRRIGGAIGMYIEEEHRKPDAIRLLVQAAIALAEELKISDIDLLISIEQTGVHKLLERFGFQKAAIQYTKHYEITGGNLPPLKNQVSEGIEVKIPTPRMIPLRAPKTQQPVLNPQGKQVFLHPVKDQTGDILRSSNGLPVYPTPLRDPQNQDSVFDESGELIVCPVLLDETGKVKEKNGIPLFKSPIFERVNNKLVLKQDEARNYLFEG